MNLSTLRVLVVEDSEDDAFLMVAALRKGGIVADWQLVATPDGLAAALIPEKNWDLITCDAGIPRLDPVEVVGDAHRIVPEVPILLVTGRYADEVDRERTATDGYVNKNAIENLPVVVRAVLRHSTPPSREVARCPNRPPSS
jgi:CheY-like chemotaxis protein